MLEQLKELSNIKDGYIKCDKRTNLGKELIRLTSFIELDVGPKERLLYLKYGLSEQVKCPTCGNPSNIDTKKDYFRVKFCSYFCRSNYINADGITLAKANAIKTAETMRKLDLKDGSGYIKRSKQSNEKLSKINPETGLTKYQERALKTAKTLSKINPETGLSGYQELGLKSKETKSKVNPETGLTKYQETGLKIKESLSKINTGSNKSIAQKRGLKIKETLSKVNPETGLNGYQEISLKSKETLSKVNPETGLTKVQERSLKSRETKSKVNPETGLTTYQENGLKAKETLSKINPESGLSGYQENGLKAKETLSKINPESGLTKFQEIGLKVKGIKSKINPETGLTKYQEIAEKNKKDRRIIGYDIIKNNIPNDFTLLTTKDEYISQNGRMVKYQHSCGEIRESYWPYVRCLKCYPYNRSIVENEILEYCKSLTDNVISNDRQIIKPKELDIVLPDFNLAFEYNGLFWHSSHSVESEVPEYHLMKTQQCMENGYQLFHIFENEWEDPIKKDIWKSIISNKLGRSERIYARKCEIRNVDAKEVKSFLKSNHLQGYVPSSINLGLFYQDELVSLMTFGKSRYGKKYDWELLRFCNKKYTSVIGGASRLFKHFTKSNSGFIVSYADMRRSTGNLYDKLGFELSHVSEPNYWYFKEGSIILESRVKYQKHKLVSLLEEYDVKLTESENMYKNGFRKIYDCGNQVWEYKKMGN